MFIESGLFYVMRFVIMNWDLLLTFTKICVPGCEIWLPMFCIIMSVGGPGHSYKHP